MNECPTYRIRNWDSNFEVAQSRREYRAKWIAVPNHHDGKRYSRLMQRPDGCEVYGAFHLILQVASKCPTRGTLADADGPLTAADIAMQCRAPLETITKALEVCSSPEIGWIETVAVNQAQETPSESAQSTLRADSERAPSTVQDITIQTPPPQNEPGPVVDSETQTEPETPQSAPTHASRLRRLGVDLAAETIRKARMVELTDQQIDQVISYAEQHATGFGPGAIVHRLTIADASQLPAHSGWPNPRPPDPKIAAAKLVAQTAQQLKADREQEQHHLDRRERLRQLELQFGPDLDELTPGQIVQLLPDGSPLREFVLSPRFGPRSPLVRDALLEAIAATKNATHSA